MGDGIIEESPHSRFFMTADNTRIEIGVSGTEFRFPPERFALIRENMEQEAGQAMSLREVGK